MGDPTQCASIVDVQGVLRRDGHHLLCCLVPQLLAQGCIHDERAGRQPVILCFSIVLKGSLQLHPEGVQTLPQLLSLSCCTGPLLCHIILSAEWLPTTAVL